MRPVRHDRAGILQRRARNAHAHRGVAGNLAVRLAELACDVDGRAREVEHIEAFDALHLLTAVTGQVVLHAVLGPGVGGSRSRDVHVRVRRIEDLESMLMCAGVVAGHESASHTHRGGSGTHSVTAAVLIQCLPSLTVGVDASTNDDQSACTHQVRDGQGREAAVASLSGGDEPVVRGHHLSDQEVHGRDLPPKPLVFTEVW